MVFTKGHKKVEGSGMKKGQKIAATLLREERRAIFEEEASQHWRETIRELRPEYIADQFMGKAAEEVNLNAKVTLDDEALIEAAKIYGASIAKRKVS